MIFVKKTFSYLKKSFLVLIVAALAPAIVLGFFSQPFSGLTFIPDYIANNQGSFQNDGFADIFFMMFSRHAIKLVFPYIIAFFAFILSCSYSVSIMEKHFKTGKLHLRNPIRSVNNSLLSVLKIVPIAIVVIFLVMLIQIGAISLIGLFSAKSTVLGYIWPIIIAIIFHLITVTLIVFFGVWVVIIQIFGFSFGDAFVESIRTSSKKWLSFISGFLVPTTITLIPVIICGILLVLPFSNYVINTLMVVKTVVDIAAFALIILYLSTYIMVSVYELTGLERRDEKSFVPKQNIRPTIKKDK